ncbi:probable G-protein coupled receptor 132 [Heteronotia binoei]|uniref:probable G-protein coupled receptor 132 n=1 Tax=Heteronotia binoei TaxID=13085 RepID=UPI00292D6A5D|nr:probable G-protein coupled receptor 132 [Heteronotia binoei]
MDENLSSTCNQTTLYEESRLPLVLVYSVIFAVGVPANIVTTILTFVQMYRGNILSIYLFGLSLCELMYLSTLPHWIIYVQKGHYWTMGQTSCKVIGYIFFCNIYISILLLCCISIDRYMAVVYPLRSRGIRTQRIAAGVTLVVFGIVAVIYSRVFFDNNIQGPNSTTCFESTLNNHLAIINIVRFLIGFVTPFAILIFMNYRIFQNVKISYSLNPQKKSKVKYLAVAIISIFVVCFAPYHFTLLVRAVHFHQNPEDHCVFENKTYTVSTIFLCLSTANSVADPFIYVLASENARNEICRTFRFVGVRFLNDSKMDSNKPSSIQKTPVDPSEEHQEDR